MTSRSLINGGYFPYCQWCTHDGSCELRHYEFSGVESKDEVDKSEYPGHEDLRWHYSGFQGQSQRAACNGRIQASGSIFTPLVCECGTAISSLHITVLMGIGFCRKFNPTEAGIKRNELACKMLSDRGESFDEGGVLTEEELALLDKTFPIDDDYDSVMIA